MTYERIVAVYDTAGKAKDAARVLEASGFPAGDISVMHRDTVNVADLRQPKLWNKLLGRDVRESENTVFTRTVEGGGGVLTLRAPDREIPRAMKILDVKDPIDMPERADVRSRTEVRDRPDLHAREDMREREEALERRNKDRGDGYDRTDVAGRVNASATAGMPPSPTSAVPPVQTGSRSTELGREEVLRLAEEQLDVGKRVVETGKARVRRFVVEKPVESQIKLHEEHATILRRPVTDGGAVKDVDWSDKVFEMTETTEQPVVSKKVRVADEVVIRREGSDRVETVRDTVRRQDIDLERPGRDRDIRDRDIRKAA